MKPLTETQKQAARAAFLTHDADADREHEAQNPAQVDRLRAVTTRTLARLKAREFGGSVCFVSSKGG